MDISRESCFEKDIHATSTNKNESVSSFSSNSDQSKKSPQKKRKEKKASKQWFDPDYFLMYTPPWATMNYIYLDLLRQLSLESEIRSNLSKRDNGFEYSYSKALRANKKFAEGQCCDRAKIKHTPNGCEDFEIACSNLCLSCHHKTKCSSCGQNIMQSRSAETSVNEVKPLWQCKCAHDSCPTILDLQHTPLTYCHYHCQKPTCYSLNHEVCGSLNNVSLDTPVREIPGMYKSIRRIQTPSDSEACNESSSNLDKLFRDNSMVTKLGTKDQPVLKISNKEVSKNDFEDDYGIVPSFLGGTGDEESKLKVKRIKKPRLPQSTAYFLPINP